jgi:hypothetical protein
MACSSPATDTVVTNSFVTEKQSLKLQSNLRTTGDRMPIRLGGQPATRVHK